MFQVFLRTQHMYCKNHHFVMNHSSNVCIFVHFFLEKFCEIVKTPGFFKKTHFDWFFPCKCNITFSVVSTFICNLQYKMNISSIRDFRTFCFSFFGESWNFQLFVSNKSTHGKFSKKENADKRSCAHVEVCEIVRASSVKLMLRSIDHVCKCKMDEGSVTMFQQTTATATATAPATWWKNS